MLDGEGGPALWCATYLTERDAVGYHEHCEHHKHPQHQVPHGAEGGTGVDDPVVNADHLHVEAHTTMLRSLHDAGFTAQARGRVLGCTSYREVPGAPQSRMGYRVKMGGGVSSQR